MRHIYSILFSVAFCMFTNAQSPVILQHNGTATLFDKASALQDAHNAAVSGDTIYLPGGFFGGITIQKKLTLYGAGHYPDSTAATFTTRINGSLYLSEEANETHIEGLYISGSIVGNSNTKIDHVSIIRNYIYESLVFSGDGTNAASQLKVSGNVIRGSIDLSNTRNATISNNILQSRTHNVHYGIIANNIYLNNPYHGYPYYDHYTIMNCDYSSIWNNIFASNEPCTFGLCENSEIKNNLFATSSVNYTSNIQSGNYTGIGSENIFVIQTPGDFKYSNNYHLKNPNNFPGTDNNETGIYGGLFPWKEGAVPSNPHITLKNIANSTNDNGELQVQIEVKAQNE